MDSPKNFLWPPRLLVGIYSLFPMAAASISRLLVASISPYLRLYLKTRRKKELMQQRVNQNENFQIC